MGDSGSVSQRSMFGTDVPVDAIHPRVLRLIDKVESAWAAFHASYAGLPESDLFVPGVCGHWSIRDLIAHVTWWDEEAITHLPMVLDGKTPPRYSVTYGGIDAFNEMKTNEKRDLTLAEVLGEAAETHGRLLAYLGDVPPERLKGTKFTHRLRLDTYGHYPIHAADIRAWRERERPGV